MKSLLFRSKKMEFQFQNNVRPNALPFNRILETFADPMRNELYEDTYHFDGVLLTTGFMRCYRDLTVEEKGQIKRRMDEMFNQDDEQFNKLFLLIRYMECFAMDDIINEDDLNVALNTMYYMSAYFRNNNMDIVNMVRNAPFHTDLFSVVYQDIVRLKLNRFRNDLTRSIIANCQHIEGAII